MATSKRLKKIYENLDLGKQYNVDEALDIVQANSKTIKIKETVEVIFNLNVDPKYQDQAIREIVQMPAGLGKEIRVAVFAKGQAQEEAKAAGADKFGADDLVAEVKSGKVDFDIAIATPDMMIQVGQLGKVLGPKGLMPNPKLGTVTKDVKKAIESAKKGQIEIKADKFGIVHAGIGKANFKKEDIRKNFDALVSAIKQVKPSGVKGTYIKKVFIGSTMNPSLQINIADIV